jgi:TRAP-type C4-dicarboxylate transport system substrate-binding protein
MATALTVSACGQSSATTASDGEVYKLTGLTSAPQGSGSEAITEWFVDQLEQRSDGRIVVDMMPSGALCAAQEVVVCVQDGRADFGVSVPDYTAQMFPDASIVGIPFLSQDHQSITHALSTLHAEHEGSRALYDKHGLTPLSTWSVGRLLFGTKDQLSSTDGLDGLKLRLSNPLVMDAGEKAGASNVAVTAPETYEAVERGVADAVGFSMDGAVSFKLSEILPNWSDPGTGHYSTFAMWLNKDVYEGLPEELRSVVDDVQNDLNKGEGTKINDAATKQLCEKMHESKDITSLAAWPEENTQSWKTRLGSTLEDRWIKDATANGLKDAESYLKRYKELLEEAGNDPSIDVTVQCVKSYQP